MASSLVKGRTELQKDNDALRDQVQALRRDLELQLSINRAMQRARSNVTLLPEAMASKFGDIRFQIDIFVADLDACLDVPSHRERVALAMTKEGSAKAFRSALMQNSDLRELAIQPQTTERHMWTAYIWRFLVQEVFSFDGVREFYAATGQNAAYYIKNIDEIDWLMQYENERPEDKYARHTWRKQAMDAVFPTDKDAGGPEADLFSTKDHPWLASNRASKIEKLAAQLLRAFGVFARILPEALNSTRKIVSHAVRFNEYMMHEAQVTYTVDLDTTSSDEDFHKNLTNMNLIAVNTDSGWPVKVDSAMKGMLQSDIRKRLYKICAIEPALQSQSWSAVSEALGLQYGAVKTEVKSAVAVGWALNRNNPPEKESMFYTMARSLGFVPEVAS